MGRALWLWCAMVWVNTRWIVFRRLAISVVLVLALTSASARTRTHYGGTLRVEVAGDGWERPTGVARRLVYDGLTQLDASGVLRPALAIAWEQDNNFHRWQFRVRPGVRFTMGRHKVRVLWFRNNHHRAGRI